MRGGGKPKLPPASSHSQPCLFHVFFTILFAAFWTHPGFSCFFSLFWTGQSMNRVLRTLKKLGRVGSVGGILVACHGVAPFPAHEIVLYLGRYAPMSFHCYASTQIQSRYTIVMFFFLLLEAIF